MALPKILKVLKLKVVSAMQDLVQCIRLAHTQDDKAEKSICGKQSCITYASNKHVQSDGVEAHSRVDVSNNYTISKQGYSC